jgi:hypothetical protein
MYYTLAMNGFFVKWLYAYRSDECTTDAMSEAASNGHLDIGKSFP